MWAPCSPAPKQLPQASKQANQRHLAHSKAIVARKLQSAEQQPRCTVQTDRPGGCTVMPCCVARLPPHVSAGGPDMHAVPPGRGLATAAAATSAAAAATQEQQLSDPPSCTGSLQRAAGSALSALPVNMVALFYKENNKWQQGFHQVWSGRWKEVGRSGGLQHKTKE